MATAIGGIALAASIGSAVVGTVGAFQQAQQQNAAIQAQLDASAAQAAFRQRQANISIANFEIQQETARNNALLAQMQLEIEQTRGEAQKAAEGVSEAAQLERLSKELDLFRGQQRASLAARGLSGSASAAALQNAALGSALRGQQNISTQTFLNKAAIDISVANSSFALTVQEAEQTNLATQFGFEVIDVNNSLESTLAQIDLQNQQLAAQAQSPFFAGLTAGITGAASIASVGFSPGTRPGSTIFGDTLGTLGQAGGFFSSLLNRPVTTSGTTSRFGGLPTGFEGFA